MLSIFRDKKKCLPCILWELHCWQVGAQPDKHYLSVATYIIICRIRFTDINSSCRLSGHCWNPQQKKRNLLRIKKLLQNMIGLRYHSIFWCENRFILLTVKRSLSYLSKPILFSWVFTLQKCNFQEYHKNSYLKKMYAAPSIWKTYICFSTF